MEKSTPPSSSSPSSTSLSADILLAQETIKNQLSYPLIEQLDNADSESTRARILNTYLTSSTQLLNTTDSLLNQENAIIETYSRNVKDCEASIAPLNADFSFAVQHYDSILAHNIASKIAKQRICIAENTVHYKEHLLYGGTTLYVRETLQKRVNYITTNKEKIAQYYNILKPQLLEELYTISRTLEVNF
jgi:predicted phage tail protein